MSEFVLQSTGELGLSAQEVRGLSRIILAVHSSRANENTAVFQDRLVGVRNLIPHVAGVQVAYDMSESAQDTSPLSTYKKVVRYQPKRAILDTRFARDNWDGMNRDIRDYQKEFIKQEEAIQRQEAEVRKASMGRPKFRLRRPDEMTVDIDMKASQQLISKTALLAETNHTLMAAIVGTSRKPLTEYGSDPADHTCELIDLIVGSGVEHFRAVTGAAEAKKVSEHCEGRSIDVSYTGGFLPEYDLDGRFKHAAGVDLRELIGIEGNFVMGTPIWEADNAYDALLAHASVLGEE